VRSALIGMSVLGNRQACTDLHYREWQCIG